MDIDRRNVSTQQLHNILNNLNAPNNDSLNPTNAQNQTNLGNTHNQTNPGNAHNMTNPGNAHNMTNPGNAQNMTNQGKTQNMTNPGDAQNMTNPGNAQNQTLDTQASSPFFIMTMSDDLKVCFTFTLFLVAIGYAVMVLVGSPFVLAGTAICFLFLLGKKLVLAMTVVKQINLSKPFSDTIIIPILDITLTTLCTVSDHGLDMKGLFQGHFVTLFFVRVLFCLLFDLGVFLYLQITHLVVACCVLFVCVFIAITIMMVLSAVLTFCARKQLQTTCNCFDAVHKFYAMFLLFKIFSLLLSIILMANQIVLYIDVGTSAALIVFTVITTFDMVFDILCFIAMCQHKLSTVAPTSSTPPEDEDQISDIIMIAN